MIRNYKIINDPVHGFVNVPSGVVSAIVKHPCFQRLRDIKQLGLTNLVYPGAVHSRLSHALGAMHLMREAIGSLRIKGIKITSGEEEGACAAMLLHDIGHGPFSHALESRILTGVSHEDISMEIISRMNIELNGALDECITIFNGSHPKRFLHQLVSGQLDTDRMDYLRRDSFFSGVAEGMIGLERIIKMLNVSGNSLVVEEKGIYSIEKFLISRRLMYWQVYLHKTVVSAERLLVSILRRVREILKEGTRLDGPVSLMYFLSREFSGTDLQNQKVLDMFLRLDDTDVMSAIKLWQYSQDKILSLLCRMLMERNLPKLVLHKNYPSDLSFERDLDMIQKRCNVIGVGDFSYFIERGVVENKGYDQSQGEIMIMSKEGELSDIYDISDMLSARAFSQITKKYFLCTANL
jgi:HD superfamily phosphohydrolase